MIVAVCADKGSPGATTLSLALALVWPSSRLVLEADPSGADLPLRLERVEGGPLLQEPSVLSLAADSRLGLPEERLPHYAQHSTLGVPVIPGAMSAEGYLAMGPLWPGVAGVAAGWKGTVIADLGRLQPGHAALPLVQTATAVVVLARPTLEGLYHLRLRVHELTHLPDYRSRARTPVAVAVLVPRKKEREGISHVQAMLAAIESPVDVVGAVSIDPRTVQAIQAARLDRRAHKTPLLSSVAGLARALRSALPELSQPSPHPHGGWPSARGPGTGTTMGRGDTSPGAAT